jgi:hypothetical protein
MARINAIHPAPRDQQDWVISQREEAAGNAPRRLPLRLLHPPIPLCLSPVSRQPWRVAAPALTRVRLRGKPVHQEAEVAQRSDNELGARIAGFLPPRLTLGLCRTLRLFLLGSPLVQPFFHAFQFPPNVVGISRVLLEPIPLNAVAVPVVVCGVSDLNRHIGHGPTPQLLPASAGNFGGCDWKSRHGRSPSFLSVRRLAALRRMPG